MVKLKAESADFEPIPAGEVVSARLVDVEVREFEWDGETVQKLRWNFVVDDPAYQGEKVTGDTSMTFTDHPNCKAYNWVTAITGRRYESGEELDTDDLMGLPCRILIGYRDGKNGKWMRVDNVYPAKASASTAPPEDAPF